MPAASLNEPSLCGRSRRRASLLHGACVLFSHDESHLVLIRKRDAIRRMQPVILR
ncbi:hypothetical protein HMPREF0762_00492 [Slackia exigua ATCC 700122]|uniref:Uncharacterized protein n=1 Tax=Slackia exigua (strain ATCC 700122 / DSM 15923 / CIP 105133 / JCM 11022 / KCTC 5966 / S-7) TaxID=649764 RepID=D0WFH4_SLAES|nr:hypothetical protein HMPREF0762_00492 [Slackia exigua ATCC 700122]